MDNKTHLPRVRDRIAQYVRDYTSQHDEFKMKDLTKFVMDQVGCAPDSPGRILRDLKEAGELDYEVVNRRQSLYRMIAVQKQGELF